jgi:hypothetical protein
MDPCMPRLAYTALAFSLFLYGCPDDSQPDSDPVREQDPVQEPVQDPVQEPSEDPVQEPVEDPNEDPVQDPSEDPVQEPVPTPTPDDDPVPPPPAQALELSGLYHSVARWDLSSAITEHPGVGTVVADLIVDQVVALSGVPGLFEDTARELVAAAIHEPIRDYVDARVPSNLIPDSPFLTDLAAIFADVEVESDIELVVAGSDGDIVDGAETVTAVRLRHGTRSLRLPVDVLDLGDASVPVGAFIDGSIDSDTQITFETRELALRIDVLLTYAATELLDALDADSLAQQVAAALECASIVELITGGDGSFSFQIGWLRFSLGVDDLLDGCTIARDQIIERAFGFINPSLGVAVGGTASALDTNGDAVIDQLVSGADYSGLITAVPLPTPTRFNASFTAERGQ